MKQHSLLIIALVSALLAGALALVALRERGDRSPQMAEEELHIHDLVVDSTAGETYIATHSFDQRLEASRDGGMTWQELPGPALIEVDWTLNVVSTTAAVFVSRDRAATWLPAPT